MKIGIVGNGVVGHATARSYLEYADVLVYDVISEKRTHDLNKVLECDLVFVCLPSPMKKDKHGCDISIIDSFFSGIAKSDICLVLKSTVPIGTTRILREKYDIQNIVHSPEFLTARCAIVDAQLPSRNIIGGWNDCANKLRELYSSRFPGVLIYQMGSDESEAVKLFQNSFFATKIGFFNEMYQLCQKAGINFDYVKESMLADGRIAHSHTNIPGPDGSFGYGGECLPKDLNNLINCFKEHLVDHPIISGVQWRNNNIDRKG